MSVRIGTNPIAWSNDDLPALGGDTPLETCLTEAREAGFVGIELGNKFPRHAAQLRPILDAHGLALISGWYSGALCERDAAAEMIALRPHLDLLKAMGCTVLTGTARFSSPLGVYDFQKRSSLIEVSAVGAQKLGVIAVELALGEGLFGHARAAEMRLNPPAGGFDE